MEWLDKRNIFDFLKENVSHQAESDDNIILFENGNCLNIDSLDNLKSYYDYEQRRINEYCKLNGLNKRKDYNIIVKHFGQEYRKSAFKEDIAELLDFKDMLLETLDFIS